MCYCGVMKQRANVHKHSRVISYFNVVFGRRLTSIWQQRQQAFAEI